MPNKEKEEKVIEVEQPADEAGINSEDIVEVPWEEAAPLFQMRASLNETQEYLANMCLNFEKQKAALVNRVLQMEQQLYQSADDLRNQKNIDDTVDYELKLANKPNEKSYFVRIKE